MATPYGFLFGLALGLMFSVGFGAASLLSPHASAQTGAPTAARRWEALRIDRDWDDGRWAREAGAEGWELVAIESNGHARNPGMFFKRPMR